MIKKTFLWTTFLVGILVLSGCSSSSTMVLQPQKVQQELYQSYNVEEVVIANNVPAEAREYFKTFLIKKLGENNQLQGSDLKIQYSFLEFNEGNQFSRWMLGGLGGAGKGALTIKTEFFNKNGIKVGEIQSKGELGAGFFGGSFQGTIEKVGEEVADYTMLNYLAKK